MSTHTLEQALFDIAQGGGRTAAYLDDPAAFLAAYVELQPHERGLIRAMDVREMLRLGVNPMLAMRAFTAVEGRERMPEYLRRLRDAGEPAQLRR